MSNYTIGQRNYQSLLSLDKELTFHQGGNYFFKLPHFAALAFDGEKARELLQGQVTSDVNTVDEQHAQRTAMCNLQGRLLMSGNLLEWQGLKMLLPADLLSTIQKSLKMPAMLARVAIKPAAGLQVFGLYISDKKKLQLPYPLPKEPLAVCFTDTMCLLALDQQRFLGLATPAVMAAIQTSFSEKGSLAWHYLALQDHEFSIYPESLGMFLPHRVDMPQQGHISFDKGCYKGQEIIARMHYRAKQKYHLKSSVITATKTPAIGDKLVSSQTNTEMGEVVDWCPVGTDRYLVLGSVLLDCPEDIILR